METLILGWYVLAETGSVRMLVLFGALQYLGALTAPMCGAVGDRIGHRNMMCFTRATYAVLAAALMILDLTGTLTPLYVRDCRRRGLLRPSDMMLRNALIDDDGRAPDGALGLSRDHRFRPHRRGAGRPARSRPSASDLRTPWSCVCTRSASATCARARARRRRQTGRAHVALGRPAACHNLCEGQAGVDGGVKWPS
jgi:hypothetical protein